MKKIMGLCLAFALCVSVLPLSVSAERPIAVTLDVPPQIVNGRALALKTEYPAGTGTGVRGAE
jgi:hypothetical protein